MMPKRRQVVVLVAVVALFWLGVQIIGSDPQPKARFEERDDEEIYGAERELKELREGGHRHMPKREAPKFPVKVGGTNSKHQFPPVPATTLSLDDVRKKKLQERRHEAHEELVVPPTPAFVPPTVNMHQSEAEAKAEQQAGFKLNKFNQYKSDRIPLRRQHPDGRHDDCKTISFDISKLPKTSVIILFHNEARSTLLRTVWSVLDNSPPELIQEILLVDDGSDLPWIKNGALDAEAKTISPKVKVYHIGRRVGLIRGRVYGAERAAGPVLTYLDSHCECTTGWLEPLLNRIHEDRTVVVTPVIDVIDKDDFEFRFDTGLPVKGVFTWSLTFSWSTPTAEEQAIRKSMADPVKSPTMAGGLFAMDKQFFEELGFYDMDMDVWGGENLEISFRIWMCGGTLEIMPCSHVGHVFRDAHPYKFPGGDIGKTITRNLNRVAEVWMDDYKDIYYTTRPDARSIGFGDVTDRKELRERLQCMSFDWYLKNVYSEMFVPTPDVLIGAGAIRNQATQLCYDVINEDNPKPGVFGCHYEGGNQGIFVVKPGQLRHMATFNDNCLSATDQGELDVVTCDPTSTLNDTSPQYFKYSAAHQFVHPLSGQCLTVAEKKLSMAKCRRYDNTQQWDIVEASD